MYTMLLLAQRFLSHSFLFFTNCSGSQMWWLEIRAGPGFLAQSKCAVSYCSWRRQQRCLSPLFLLFQGSHYPTMSFSWLKPTQNRSQHSVMVLPHSKIKYNLIFYHPSQYLRMKSEKKYPHRSIVPHHHLGQISRLHKAAILMSPFG